LLLSDLKVLDIESAPLLCDDGISTVELFCPYQPLLTAAPNFLVSGKAVTVTFDPCFDKPIYKAFLHRSNRQAYLSTFRSVTIHQVARMYRLHRTHSVWGAELGPDQKRFRKCQSAD
jgi:hypothetical protein